MTGTQSAWRILDDSISLSSDDQHTSEMVSTLLTSFAEIDPVGVSPDNTFFVATRVGGFELRRGDQLAEAHPSRPELILRLLAEINRSVVDSYLGFAAHAGVVALKDRVIAIPGVSGAGKSTITAACLAAGFDYLSDEALCIEFDGQTIDPYPRPLQLHKAAFLALGLDVPIEFAESTEAPITPHDLGARTASPGLRLAEVVFLDRRPGRTHLQAMPRGEAAGSLLSLSFNHYKRPAASFELVTEIMQTARGWVISLEDPLEGARRLQSEFA